MLFLRFIIKMKKRNILKCTICFFAVCTILYGARSVEYIILEFVIRWQTYRGGECAEKVNANVQIPTYIHQIYFPIKAPTVSSDHKYNIITWQKKHSNFTYKLWNEYAVLDLIRKEYPDILTLYNSYGHWVQRVDVAKYIILYHHGGWYVDLDISCKQSLVGLAEDMAMRNKSVVMYAEENARVATDFFGITPRHPFMKSVIDALPFSNRWFLSQHTTIMISTGPSFMMGRYLNYPCQDDILVLSLDNFAKYALLSHDCSWCGQDSFSICFVEDHKLLIVCIILLIVIVMFILFKTKGYISRSLKHYFKRFHNGKQYDRKTV